MKANKGFLGTRDFWEHGIFGNKGFLVNEHGIFGNKGFLVNTGFLANTGFLGTRDSWEQGIFWDFTNTGFGRRDSN